MNSSYEQDEMINFKCSLLTHQVSIDCAASPLDLDFEPLSKDPYHQGLETYFWATSLMNAYVAQGGACSAQGPTLGCRVNRLCTHPAAHRNEELVRLIGPFVVVIVVRAFADGTTAHQVG